MTVVVPAQISSTPTAAPPTETQSSGGTGTGTYIGLGVAGGIAVLGLIAFIVWKFNQKRFSQLDDDGE
jgi:asparagine N-glycosylation enzyme membrane subunit Stt3